MSATFSIKDGLASVTKMMEDPYGGFDDYDHAYDPQALSNNRAFQQAVARSSHGRRPTTSSQSVRAPSSYGGPGGPVGGAAGGVAPPSSYGAMNSSYGRMRTGRLGTAAGRGLEPARPMTAVRAAGYTSYANKVQANEMTKIEESEVDNSDEAKAKDMENKVMDILKESIFAAEKRNFKEALEKAKEAGRRERLCVKYREQHKLTEGINLDLMFTVLVNLAEQHMNNDMINEALNGYEVIVANKEFKNSGKLKVNIGNIYFKRKDYNKAIKYYRMALDQVPSVQKHVRIKILNNIGVAFIKLGKYDDALSTFEHCVDEKPEFGTALNLVLTAYCLEDEDRMRNAFQNLLDIEIKEDDDAKPQEREDVLMNQVLNSDSLRQWEKARRRDAEKAIITAARVIAPAIAHDFASGYQWCVEAIKQSVHSSLATELEMSKAGELLKAGDVEGAKEVLKVFHSQDSKISGTAANNLAMISLLQGGEHLQEAEAYSNHALTVDHYNANALVNAGNIWYQRGELEKAMQHYREALTNDAECVQALYNMGLVSRQQGNLEQALECFYKLQHKLSFSVQVMCQLAAIYESLEDSQQAGEFYGEANDLASSDPAILEKLADIHDAEGDKSQAFQYNYDSYRAYPSNMKVIQWIGAYYIDSQYAEKAANYFEKASIMQPSEIKWQLMMASSHRRAGNYQKALELYKSIHRKFPSNTDCLKFLVRLCTDLGMSEAREYAEKLQKAERVHALRAQRESDSSQGKRHSANSTSNSLPPPTAGERPNSLTSLRMSSAQFAFEDKPFEVAHRDMKSADFSYADPVGPAASRPKTGSRRQQKDDSFDDLDESLLPQ